MDPNHGSSSSTPSHVSTFIHPPRTTSTIRDHDHGESSGRRAADSLRRGHSDGVVLASGQNSKSSVSTEEASVGDRQTLMDFLRDSSDARHDCPNGARLAANRAAIMAADRRRRLSEHHEDQSRKRSSSSISFGHTGSNRPRQGFIQSFSDRPHGGPSNITSSHHTQRITDRPLPRRPSIEIMQNRRSREITLPKWQPDAEVTKCPICGTTFSFWYRKHHCRKCGRVVCANCSPHRITIPRQFIVHPPEDATPSPSTAAHPGVEVVDLTGAEDAADSATHPLGISERPQSSDYRIDPALGGGQEVRLCNPCVPDPNPLPHLPHLSPVQHSFDSFLRPDRIASSHNRRSIPDLPGSGDGQLPSLTRQGSSGRPDYRPTNAPRFEPNLAPLGPLTSPAGSSTSRRHSHAPRPLGSPMSPPNYSTTYGSAPDQTAQQVRSNLDSDLI